MGKFWVGLILGAVIAAILLMSFGGVRVDFTSDNIKNYAVKLEIKKNAKKIKIKKNKKMLCADGSASKYGCLDVAEGDEAIVKFELDDSSGSSFFVSEMTICKGKNKAQQDCNLNTDEQMEFAITRTNSNQQYPPNEKGVISFGKIPERLTEFRFINVNLRPGDYFYTIKACPSSGVGSECIESDPGIKNGGRQLR